MICLPFWPKNCINEINNPKIELAKRYEIRIRQGPSVYQSSLTALTAQTAQNCKYRLKIAVIIFLKTNE